MRLFCVNKLTPLRCILVVLSLFATMSSQAATVLIDFGSSANTTTEAGTTWNNITGQRVGTAGSSIASLLDTAGAVANMAIAVTGDFNGINTAGVTTGSTLFPASAQIDSFYGNAGTSSGFPTAFPNGQLTLSNLDPLLFYTFTFFASRSGTTPNRETDYTVTGMAGSQTVSLEVAQNVNSSVTVSGVQANQNGQILIDLSPGSNNGTTEDFYYIGALKIETSTVPEPGRSLLLMAALVYGVGWRRRISLTPGR